MEFFETLKNIPFLDIPKVQGRFKSFEHIHGNQKVKELKFCVPIKNTKNWGNENFSPIVNQEKSSNN